MSRRTLVISLVCAVAVFAATVGAQVGADAARPPSHEGQLLYLPNEKLLNHFTGGMSSIIADLLWLRCVQYVATESKGERNFRWLNEMLLTVVRLDPHFTDVYRYGGMFLAALKADSDAGLELLEQGIVADPESWELPYEAAMVYLLNRGDAPDSRRRAAYYLSMSAATGKAPELIRDLAQKLQSEYNLLDIERGMWTDLLHSEDQLLRDLAARKLEETKLKEICQVLQQRLGAFEEVKGRPAKSIEELLASGAISGLPRDPFGGRFIVDGDGFVQSTTLLDETTARNRNIIRNALDAYHETREYWPESLDALVREGLLTELPGHPYTDRAWDYDSGTGELN